MSGTIEPAPMSDRDLSLSRLIDAPRAAVPGLHDTDRCLRDEDGKTRYTARARHWTPADKQAHEAMGFHQGWGICADQLARLAGSL